MGRKRKIPLKDGRIVPLSTIGQEAGKVNPDMIDDAVMDRLGHTSLVCQNCNHKNPDNRETCRKCQSKNLREFNSTFEDE